MSERREIEVLMERITRKLPKGAGGKGFPNGVHGWEAKEVDGIEGWQGGSRFRPCCRTGPGRRRSGNGIRVGVGERRRVR